jgi:hypothetical protein
MLALVLTSGALLHEFTFVFFGCPQRGRFFRGAVREKSSTLQGKFLTNRHDFYFPAEAVE